MNKKILVAEDNDAILDAIKIILEMNGYFVDCTTDGKTVENIKDNLPDLLLLDVWMGKHDGRKICKHLKNQAKTKDIPIIMISATRDLEKSAQESGADDFLEKPFEIEDLLAKVKRFIQ